MKSKLNLFEKYICKLKYMVRARAFKGSFMIRIFFMISGVDGLRVVDASIFPQIPSGNLNAPTIMTAERMSDLIKNKTPLPPANVPVYKPSQLETRR